MQRSVFLSLLPALAALFAFACAAACARESRSSPGGGAPPPPAVDVTEVALREVAAWDELPGRVEPVDEVEIRARVSGHVVAVVFREGAVVAPGDVLFRIDPRPYRAALARTRADHARARARLELARLEARRAETLLASNAIARAERDTLVSVAAQAAAELDATASAVALAELELGFTTIRAPLAGRAGRAAVDVGDFVAPGAPPLTTVVSLDPVYVAFDAEESLYLRHAAALRAGTPVPVQVGVANDVGFPHAGKVDFVANRLDAGTGTIEMRAVVPNADGALTPGLYARVRLAGGAAPAVVIDERAILTDQDRKYVLAVDGQGLAQRKDVALGRLLDGKRVVTKGLATGDRVIVSGVAKVMIGAPVAPRPATEARGSAVAP